MFTYRLKSPYRLRPDEQDWVLSVQQFPRWCTATYKGDGPAKCVGHCHIYPRFPVGHDCAVRLRKVTPGVVSDRDRGRTAAGHEVRHGRGDVDEAAEKCVLMYMYFISGDPLNHYQSNTNLVMYPLLAWATCIMPGRAQLVIHRAMDSTWNCSFKTV